MSWKLATWLVVLISTCGSGKVVLRNGNQLNNTSNATTIKITQPNHDNILVDTTIQENLNPIEGDNLARLDYEEDTNMESESGEMENDQNLEISDDGSEEPIVDNVVETTHGRVEGFIYNDTGNIISYIDIPYGKIDGYFQPPMETEPWAQIHQVQAHTTKCPQPEDNETIAGDLDCLTLSIFTPTTPVNAGVLFHIHDGSFKVGSGDPTLYGPEHLVPKGVILVLPNYRLGPLGFMCLKNETAPGNAGLKDLTLALNWIVNNIAAFGGDPSNIVVSGEGLAGILVGYLALSPMSSIYISKVITESGSVLSQWAIDRDPVNTALHLAAKLSENEESPSRLLQESSLSDLILQAKDMLFLPCVEETAEAFMNQTPWNAIQHTSMINKTFMIGSANFAGLHDCVTHTAESIEQLNNDVRLLVPNDLCFADNAERVREAENIKRQYFEDGNITVENIDNLSLYYTDSLYLGPGIRTARPLLQAGAAVYLYEFSFVGALNREVLELPVHLVAGAARGDLVGYLFTKHGETPEEGSEEQRIVDLMTDVWVSFVNTGRPTAEGVTWNELLDSPEADEEWLSIGFNVTQERGLHVPRLALWTRLYRDHYIESNHVGRLATSLLLTLTMFLLII